MEYFSTLGTDFVPKQVTLGGKKVRAAIWDTAGQERFRTITRAFYEQAQGFMLVYDVTNRDSFEAVPNWIKSIQDNARSNAVVVILGNKIDLADKRVITKAEGKEMAKEFKLRHFETSAKTNKNVTKAFETAMAHAFLESCDPLDKTRVLLRAQLTRKKQRRCC